MRLDCGQPHGIGLLILTAGGMLALHTSHLATEEQCSMWCILCWDLPFNYRREHTVWGYTPIPLLPL